MSIEAEESLIAAILNDPSCMSEVDLEPRMFSMRHRPIWEAMLSLVAEGTRVEYVTLSEKLGMSYAAALIDISEAFGSPANIKAYADIVRRDHHEGEARAIGRELLDDANADKAVQALMQIDRVSKRYNSTLQETLNEILSALDNPENLAGFPTGLAKLDTLTGGWHRGDLIILGARPSVGKTAAMLNFARSSGERCLIVSGEQDDFQIGLRLLANQTGVPLSQLRSGKVADENWAPLVDGVAALKDAPLFFYDKPAPTLLDVQREARRYVFENDVGVIFVDYLQRMQHEDLRVPRHTQIEWDVKGLKEIARELNVAVVCLAQVKREVDNRDPDDRCPRMSDLGDSGSIEREADIIMTMTRVGAYRDLYQGEDDAGILRVVKNRHGKTGQVLLVFDGDRLQFKQAGWQGSPATTASIPAQFRV